MRALVSLLIGGATFGLGVATGVALAAIGTVMCRAVEQSRRRGQAPEETDPATKRT
jgi:predicted PurR-regulated permease PerM